MVFNLMSERQTSGPDDPDHELMLLVQAGDESAFQKLLERYFVKLTGFADRFFHNRAIAEEAVQEIFIKVYRARKRYQPNAKFSTWLYTIATRTCLNELRRGVYQKRHESYNDDLQGRAIQHQPAVAQEVEGRHLHRKVEEILDSLPTNQRAALILVRFGGHSYTEVATILGISESAVKSQIFRATDAVRRGLKIPENQENPQ